MNRPRHRGGLTAMSLPADLVVSDAVHGEWCDQCLLPSATTVTLTVSTAARVLGIHRVTICDDCGHHREASP